MKRNLIMVAGALTMLTWLGCKHTEEKGGATADYQTPAASPERSVAASGDFNFPSGTYGKRIYYTREDRINPRELRFEMDRGSIKVVDNPNKIVYVIDLHARGEQLLNPQAIENMRRSPKSRAIGNIIDHITVSDIESPRDDRLTAKFNVYLKNATPFGTLSAKIVIGAAVTRTNCTVTKYTTSHYSPKQLQTTCLQAETATEVSVAGIQTGLPKGLNNGLGLLFDTVLKVMSPTIGQDSVYVNYQ